MRAVPHGPKFLIEHTFIVLHFEHEVIVVLVRL